MCEKEGRGGEFKKEARKEGGKRKEKGGGKGKIVETTLATQPVLRAVHLSSRSTAKER